MQLPLDESGKCSCPGKVKKMRPEINFEPVPSHSVAKLSFWKKFITPDWFICLTIKVNESMSLECDIFMDFDRLSKKQVSDFREEVTKIWKDSIRHGKTFNSQSVEKVCVKTFKGYHFQIYCLEQYINAIAPHPTSCIDFIPKSKIWRIKDSRTFYDFSRPVLARPIPFSAKIKHSSTFFN